MNNEKEIVTYEELEKLGIRAYEKDGDDETIVDNKGFYWERNLRISSRFHKTTGSSIDND